MRLENCIVAKIRNVTSHAKFLSLIANISSVALVIHDTNNQYALLQILDGSKPEKTVQKLNNSLLVSSAIPVKYFNVEIPDTH